MSNAPRNMRPDTCSLTSRLHLFKQVNSGRLKATRESDKKQFTPGLGELSEPNIEATD